MNSRSGFGGHVIEINLADAGVRTRTDVGSGGLVTELTRVRASRDRSAIGLVVGDDSGGPVFRYSAASDTFSAEHDLSAFTAWVALDPTGTTMLVGSGTYVLDAQVNLSGTIAGFGSDVAALSPQFGLRVNGAAIEQLDLKRFLVVGSFALPDTLNPSWYGGDSIGALATSADGGVIAAVTDHGFVVVAPP